MVMQLQLGKLKEVNGIKFLLLKKIFPLIEKNIKDFYIQQLPAPLKKLFWSEHNNMGQMIFIDEDELKELQIYKNIAEQYRKTFEKVYPILLPEVNNIG